GLALFEPGTQGEHKISRGFEPIATWSLHRLADPRFQRALEPLLRQEERHVDRYMESARDALPFKACSMQDAGGSA
ncbi:MAG: peptidogalycan biosysnthesis protein, partial [Gammaproteobacteria bacterium]